MTNTPQQDDYVTYATNHIRELIDRYKPSVLWNDIRYPKNADLVDLFSYYYETIPDGVINDRWNQRSYAENAVTRVLINTAAWFYRKFTSGQADPPGIHCDYITPEYQVFNDISRKKWEACRGLGSSFGYNRNETVAHLLSAEELIRSFVDIVSKNGNLLINVGPMADGTIPEAQRERLERLGDWLAIYGEAIYGTRPWVTAEGTTAEGISVRFTQKGDSLFAIVLGTPETAELSFESLELLPGTQIHLLGQDNPLSWRQEESHVTVALTGPLPDFPAHAFKIAPWPRRC
jgi:alpha-L-fucosidase